MRSAFLFLFSFLTFCSLSAQDNVSLPEADVLCTIGNQTISVSAFERAYNKNYNVNVSEKQSVDEYFSLYLKFRLKVTAALDAKMDTLSSFKQELKSYRDQLAKSYLSDNDAMEMYLQESYYRTVNEVKASHIMIRLPEKATLSESNAALQKITAIRNRILAGESFERLAVELSDDPSAKSNQGNIGYFSAFRFPYSFESACYNATIGEVSLPVRTRYGYHLVKVYDKRLSPGEVKVAHIMLAVPQDAPEAKWEASRQKMVALADRIQKGEDFGKLALEASDDHNSAKNKGELQWFGSGRMVSEFEDAAFSMKTVGEVSAPVKTHFGWHIIKLLDKRSIAPYTTIKGDLKNSIIRDERGEAIVNSFLQKIKLEYNYREYPENRECFLKLDSSVYQGNVDQIPVSSRQLPLFTIQQHSYTVDNFRLYISSHKSPDKTVAVSDFIQNSFVSFVKASLIDYADQHLEEKYSDFKNLADEYHDGILLFNMMDLEVWKKATQDSIGLEKFFRQTASKYNWKERLDATIYKFSDILSAEKARDILRHSPGLTPIALKKLCCDTLQKSVCFDADHRLFSKGDNAIIDSLGWKKGLTKVFVYSGSAYIVAFHEKRKPEPKKLEEVRGLVTAEYQNVLEEKWLNELNTKYKVVVNQELLHKIANKYKINH